MDMWLNRNPFLALLCLFQYLSGFTWFILFCSSGIRNAVIVGVFSPASKEQEVKVAEIIRSAHPDMSLTLSHEVGLIGLLERENAAVLNESLKPLCKKTVAAFCEAFRTLGLKCPFYLTQNDGTIIRYIDFCKVHWFIAPLTFTQSHLVIFKVTGAWCRHMMFFWKYV